MIGRVWEKLTGIDRLKKEIKRLREVRDANFESMVRANDRAYDRRQALKAIAACETPSANGTVKRMAKIARAALETTHFADKVRDAAVTVEGQPGDTYHVIVTGGGGGGAK